MNKILIWLVAAGLALAALAQDAEGPAAAHERIARQRGEVEAVYKADEQACYQKFAVNDCLRQARSLRRQAMADLKRQETSVNDAERRRKGAERQRAIEERAQAEGRRSPSAGTAPAAPAHGMSLPGPTLEQRQAKRAQAQQRNAADAAARQHEQQGRQREKEVDAARRKADAAANADRQEKARAEAQEHKAGVQRRLAERAGSRAQPLPPP